MPLIEMYYSIQDIKKGFSNNTKAFKYQIVKN